ncbi:MAG: DNA-binding protein [Campylobacterales bacterium]|nr:DNA-binding protein [Campylobacterales bacterium]
MKKLVSTNEAAQILGISLQGVHYRIKKEQLESVKKDGKTFVYIDPNSLQTSNATQIQHTQTQPTFHEELIKAKDDQILLLKKTIKFLKKEKEKEIGRLEKNQSKMVEVFKSEIELLKSAFNEMKKIYALEYQTSSNLTKKETINEEKPPMQLISLADFFRFMRSHNKSDSQIKSIVLDRIKSGDKRFIYNKTTKDVVIYKSDFLDLL